MVSNRCKMAVKDELQRLGLHFIVVDLGEVEIMENLNPEELEQLRLGLLQSGLELMEDKRAILIEKAKNVIQEMIYFSEDFPKVNYSEYLSEKLNCSYSYLADLFSEVKGITIQQFIINQKIERAKELLIFEELSLTEISYKLRYSSVAHLSNQFKKITGLSPTQFKNLKSKKKEIIKSLSLTSEISAENGKF